MATRRAKKKSPARKGESATTKKRGKRRRGQPPFVPTAEQRQQVELLVGLQLTYEEVATVVINPRTRKGISTRTLQDHFKVELQQGQAKVKANVVASLVAKAVSKDHPQSAICAMFIAKCRFGWRQEDKLVHEIDAASTGVLVAPAAMLPEEWIADQRRKNAAREAPQSREEPRRNGR